MDSGVTCVPCACGGSMIRVIGMPNIQLEGITGAFPGAHERWARVREEKPRSISERVITRVDISGTLMGTTRTIVKRLTTAR